ncbi:hypothetical protein [Neobacillus dielmonensis]|uniref:hypothetical protein n=1 Tax=Neobacillus dielmonensis TaxID=1347369 RepID=UPI0005A6C2E7|nr:hypothetical protein [Neobacillus dielmonensis]
MKKRPMLYVGLLIITLGFAAYLDSPFSILNINYSYTADQPVIAEPVDVKPSADDPEVVEKLEKTEKKDGYIIETYKEYEIVRDKDGKIVSNEPTGKEDTLKYYDYSKNKDR